MVIHHRRIDQSFDVNEAVTFLFEKVGSGEVIFLYEFIVNAKYGK